MKSASLTALALKIACQILPVLPPLALILLLNMIHLIFVLSAQELLASDVLRSCMRMGSVSPSLRPETEWGKEYVDSAILVLVPIEMKRNISDGKLPRYASVTN